MSNYGYPITIVYRAKHTFKSNVTALFLKYKYYNTLNIILFVTVLTLLKKISTVDLKMCEEYIDFLKQIASLELTALEDRIRDVASIVQGHPVMDRSFFLGESIEPQASSSALTQALLPQPHGAADGNVGLFPGPCQRVFPTCLVPSTDQTALTRHYTGPSTLSQLGGRRTSRASQDVLWTDGACAVLPLHRPGAPHRWRGTPASSPRCLVWVELCLPQKDICWS